MKGAYSFPNADLWYGPHWLQAPYAEGGNFVDERENDAVSGMPKVLLPHIILFLADNGSKFAQITLHVTLNCGIITQDPVVFVDRVSR